MGVEEKLIENYIEDLII